MSTTGSEVEIGAVLAAWDQACVIRSGLQARTDPDEWADPASRLAVAAPLYGPDQLGRGTIVLLTRAIGGLCAGLAPRHRERIAHTFATTLLEKLSALTASWPKLVESADLPMVRTVVDLALAGRNDPLAWRYQAGPVTDSEHRALTAALALTAEFVDLVDGPGACARQLLSSVDSTLG